MNPKVIVIDGKTYHSVDEMPPDVRQKYEEAMRSLGDEDNNLIADVVEKITAGQPAISSMKIIVDGKEFGSIENLPPEARARYEAAMGKLDANRNGIPDFVERMTGTSNQPVNVSASFGGETSRRSASNSQEKPIPVSATITPDTSNGWMLVLAGVFILLLCVASAAGVWYFFLR
jgi:hypothetical protein